MKRFCERFCNRYCMVRTKDAGVFAGTLEDLEIKTGTAVVTNARRIFWWEGAASLSQLATTGTSRPTACKFPAPVKDVLLLNVIEILTITDEAARSIASVEEWVE